MDNILDLSVQELSILSSNLAAKGNSIALKYILNTIKSNPDNKLFKKQIIPEGNWRYHLALCGRSFGKTVMGSGWMYKQYLRGYKSLALVGATYDDVAKVMVPAIISWTKPQDNAHYNKQSHIISFGNGCQIYCYSADTQIRGPNLEKVWLDEICKFNDSIPEKIKETFDVLNFAVRIGKQPQIIITSTPKSFPWFIEFENQVQKGNPSYQITRGTIFDNPYIEDSVKNEFLNTYSGTRIGRQELYGELIKDIEGALWNTKLIDDTRISEIQFKANKIQFERIVVAVDPAVSDGKDSDLTGIIVAGIAKGHCYILADVSGRYSPSEWAIKVISLYHSWRADRIIAEKNQGGALVESNLRNIDHHAPITLVHAKHGKITRAEPVAALFEQQKVHIVGIMSELETEMVTYDGNSKKGSPDRMDAMVYAVTELMLRNQYAYRDFSSAPVMA